MTYKNKLIADKAVLLTARATVWMTIFNCILALVGLVTLWILINQLKEMRNGEIDTHSVQRAFIYADEFDLIPERNHNDPSKIDAFTFFPKIRNSGSTPALAASYWVNKWYSVNPIDKSFHFPDSDSAGNEVPPEKQIPVTMFFPPQSVQDLNVPLTVPGQTMLDVNNGKTHVYFYGWIKYHDVFKDTDQHLTMFCVEAKEFKQIQRFGGQPATIQLLTGTCPNNLHNCVDKQCNI